MHMTIEILAVIDVLFQVIMKKMYMIEMEIQQEGIVMI